MTPQILEKMCFSHSAVVHNFYITISQFERLKEIIL